VGLHLPLRSRASLVSACIPLISLTGRCEGAEHRLVSLPPSALPPRPSIAQVRDMRQHGLPAACYAISWSLLPPELLACISQTKDVQPVSFNIIAASTGEVFSAKVLTQYGKLWAPKSGEGFRIAGVPGLAAPVELKFPLNASSLPTGRPTDSVSVDGETAGHLLCRGVRSTSGRSTK
jgi:hypothetical protein